MPKKDKVVIHKDMGHVPNHILIILENYCTQNRKYYLNKLIQPRILLPQLRKVYSWETPSLDIWFSQQKILQSIRHISFPRLRILNLCFDLIDSVEGLTRLQAPNIEIIWLKDNKLCDICSLKKISSSKITQIWISNNAVKEIGWISQMNLKKPKYIGIESYISKYQIQQITPIVKIEHKVEQQVQISFSSRQRIVQKPLIQCLNRKYPSKRATIVAGKIQ